MDGARKNMRYLVEETAAKHERVVKKASRLLRKQEFENVSVPATRSREKRDPV